MVLLKASLGSRSSNVPILKRESGKKAFLGFESLNFKMIFKVIAKVVLSW